MLRPDVAVTGKIVPGGELAAVGRLRSKANVARKGHAGRLIAPEGHPDQHEAASQQPGGQQPDPEIVFVSTVIEALHAALVRHPAKGFVPPA
jgi:ATP-dependent Lon protease